MKQVWAAGARLFWTLAIIAIVVVVNRSQSGADASAEAVRCELEPPHEIAGLESCLARSPRDVELVLELAAAYEAAGRTADALTQYARAVEIDPHDGDARKRLDERQ